MEKEPKQHEVLRRASLFLEENNREPKMAELLLKHYLDVTRTVFLTMMHDPIPETVLRSFCRAVTEHAETGVPLEHITGYATFYGRDFQVNEHTLIPRPETEELVQHFIQAVSNEPLRIVDIGTGSGIIAITLALELPNATVYATDISEKALEVARQNAKQLDSNVTFLQGDYLQPLIEQHIEIDMIVSNPPYIASADKTLLSDTVKNFEPEQALFADDNGLAAFKKIIHQLPETMKPCGCVFLEIGHKQGADVQSLLQKAFPKSDVAIIPDMNGKDRIIKMTVNNA
ncbi:release factor glutamine methyltransferase [Lentibacillus halodurans]|uniref:Release factor glutamine methyltransferase n=1 Tax=Lentibacillus halodurans TaxID=237679 RepID=A0A1I0ZQ85_9BACI|nr:peptide chain release factor N(5)-glutamine methyltransferase [Lentibacillus halodurans]SFB26303.1 release factor glutamine methyltransferase [Lentibacillus halodurans]